MQKSKNPLVRLAKYVSCPVCFAVEGDSCVDGDGWPRSVHKKRMRKVMCLWL